MSQCCLCVCRRGTVSSAAMAVNCFSARIMAVTSELSETFFFSVILPLLIITGPPEARYTLATKLYSTRSTLLKVDCC